MSPEELAALREEFPFICQACSERFDRQVWHCPGCAHHWPMHRDTCSNCHNFEITPDGQIVLIEFDDEDSEEDEEPEEQSPEDPEPKDRDEAAQKWTDLINHFCHVNTSLQRRGGIAALSRQWSRRNKEGFVRAVEEVIAVFQSVLIELKESLHGTSES